MQAIHPPMFFINAIGKILHRFPMFIKPLRSKLGIHIAIVLAHQRQF